MKLIFIGTGSAFTVGQDNYQSNVLIQDDKKKFLLIDCGSDARFALYEMGLSYREIQDVYISHLHGDHVGGLEWLGFTTKFDDKCEKPNLYLHKNLVDDLWNKVLAGGLSSIQDEKTNLNTYFNVSVIKDYTFTWQGVKFTLVETLHTFGDHLKNPSFGLLFSLNSYKVFLTTDTQFCPDKLLPYYQNADIIFQDCETAAIKSGVHAHYSDLVTLDKKTKKKMWLYHYNPGSLPDAKKDGFRGFVQKGQCFDFKDKRTL